MTTDDDDDDDSKELPTRRISAVDPRSVLSKSWISSTRSDNSCFLFSFAFLTVSLSSGLVYGWPSLRRNLVTAGGSTLSEKRLGLIFTVGSWSTQGGRFLVGLARDRWLGTRIATALSLLAATIGCLGIAFSNASNVTSLAISFFFVGMGSGGQLCLQPVAGLFRKKTQGTVLVSLSGAFQISGLVFLVLTVITEDRKKSFGTFSACLIALTIASVMILPKHQFVKKGASNTTEQVTQEAQDVDSEDGSDLLSRPAGQNHQRKVSWIDNPTELNEANNADRDEEATRTVELAETKHVQGSKVTFPKHDIGGNRHDNDSKDDKGDATPGHSYSKCSPENEKPVMALICSLEYVLLVAWFSLLLVPSQYYIASIGFQLERKGDDSGTYTALFSMIYAASAVVSPISGKIADVFGLGVTQAIATMLTAASLFFLASNELSLNVQVVGMVFYAVGRLSFFGMFFTNVGKRFGYTHFGTLAGLGLIISAIVSLAQYPLISLVADGKESLVNNVCAATILVFLLPYCFWLGLRERQGEGNV